MNKPYSIRDALERDAWRNHPEFARRCSRRRARPAPAWPGWPDRALLGAVALLLLAVLVLAGSEPARADGADEPFWGIEAGAARALALDTAMNVEVTGLVARVEITQRFSNRGAAWAEAVYRFPLPPGAAVDRLRIEAGGRIIEGEIREKDDARRQYQQARDSGRLASLVEQQRPNQFETRLANVGPGEEVRVAIAFLARVDFQDGAYRLRLPLTFTPRWDPGPALPAGSAAAPHPLLETPHGDGHRLEIDLLLHAADGLASLESRYHDIDVHPTLGGYRVYLADPDTRTDRDFELEWRPDFGAVPTASLLTWDGTDAVYALLMLVPPLAQALPPQPREVVFVIDTSGSMEGASMDQAKAALRRGLQRLEPDDRFNLVRFDSDTEALFEASVPAWPAELAEAAEFVDELEADGGTDMAPALDLAMGLPAQDGLLRQIVFVTDGSVGNGAELLLRIGQRLGDSRLFTVSIGAAPNAWFMRKAAEVGRGSHSHIGRPEDVEERMNALWRRIEHPAVQDLCVDWGMDAEYFPEVIPDLYAGEPLWLSARLPFEPREITVCGELDGLPWETTSSLAPLRGSEDLARLWARSKIEALQDSRVFGADPELVRLESLSVALEFGLLSPWTSLVAVDRTPVRPQAEPLASGQLPGLLPAGSTLSTGFTQTATGWPLRLALALLCTLIVTAMLLHATPSRAAGGGDARLPEPAPAR